MWLRDSLVAQVPRGRLSYCILILKVTTTLRRVSEALADFADGASEETVAAALAITAY